MKKISYLHIPLAFTLLPCMANATATDTLVFSDNYESSVYLQTPVFASRAGKASNSKGGLYKVAYEWPSGASDEWKDMVETCFSIAADFWNPFLDGDSIRLHVLFDSNQSEDAITSVFILQNDTYETSYPLTIYRKRIDPTVLPNEQYDAEVVLKGDTNWTIGVGEEAGGKSLTLAFIRSIAATMGFGSSLNLDSRNRVNRPTSYYSLFDSLVVNGNGVWLRDIQFGTNATAQSTIRNYVQAVDYPVYVAQADSAHKLYTPNPFEKDISLRFLDGGSSVMSYPRPDSLEFAIDGVTNDIMEKMGWKSGSTVDIAWYDSESTGMASAYESNTFYLDAGGSTVTSYQWTCTLTLSDGTAHVYATSTGSQITVPAIADETLYEHTPEGEINALIEFTGMVDGDECHAVRTQPLQLKPRILTVSPNFVFTAHESLEDFYTIDFDLKYEGCYYIYVLAKPWYSSAATAYYFRTPYIAHVTLHNVDLWAGAKVTVRAVNPYGTVTKTFNVYAPTPPRRLQATTPEVVGILPGGSLLQPNDTLTDGNVCEFRLDSGGDAEWTVYLEGNTHGLLEVASATGSSVTLEVTPGLMKGYQNDWLELRRHYDGSGTVYFKGFAQARTEEAQADTLPFMLRVFPRKPRITVVDLRYDAFDETCSAPVTGWFWEPSVTLEAQVYDARWVSWHSFFYGTTGVCIRCWEAFEGDGTVAMKPHAWDIDECIYAVVSNEYGYAYSDTILVNDYIDPDIMHIIDEYYERVNSVNDALAGMGNGCGLSLSTEAGEKVISVEAFDMDGRKIPAGEAGNDMKSKVRHGIYIMRIRTDKRIITKKVKL